MLFCNSFSDEQRFSILADKSEIALCMFSHSRVREEFLSSNFNANGTLGQYTMQKNLILLQPLLIRISYSLTLMLAQYLCSHILPLTEYCFVFRILHLVAGHITLLRGYFTFKIYRHLSNNAQSSCNCLMTLRTTRTWPIFHVSHKLTDSIAMQSLQFVEKLRRLKNQTITHNRYTLLTVTMYIAFNMIATFDQFK